MKRFFHILSLCIIGAAICACSSDKDTIIPDQREAFERYITSKKLESTENNGVYRCVTNSDREGYIDEPVVEYGDVVDMCYTLYVFSGSSFNEDSPIYSTDPDVIAELEKKYEGRHFDWPVGPHPVTIGQTKMIKGLEYGLTGLRNGDDALLLITSNLAFGGDQLGAIPEDTPVVYKVHISQITKQ